MKQLFQWVMAATLICGLSVFTACSSGSDDNQEPVVKPDPVVNPDPDDNGANSSSSEIGYIECSWNGSEVVKTPKVAKAINLASEVTGTGWEKELPAGVYYVSGYLSVTDFFVIKGGSKVDIILCDGAELKVPCLRMKGSGTRLRIFGQENGTGSLTTKSDLIGMYSGIGAQYSVSDAGYDLEFHGGIITAYGSVSSTADGAGIGKGFNSITIYGGTINATGGEEDAAGIGGGENDTSGIITIYGGTVTAQGGENAAGIGGGDGKSVSSINIHGGTVYAYAGVDGAGIGGGEDGDSGDILITGGTVYAYGDRKSDGSSNKGYGAGIGSGQNGNVNTIIIKGGDVQAYGGMDAAGIGTGEEYGSDINSGTIEIHGGKVWAEGKGYGAGIGCGEDATFGVLGISGGRVDAHAGSDCGPWSGGIGAYHKDHGADDNCHIGWAGWERIYIAKGMRLWTYSPNVGSIETVTNNLPWWNYVHQRPQAAFDVCDHPGYTEATCPFCYRETLQLQ